ncbi:MAG TPA: anthranilate phosphoribosyltransferase [Sphingomicrobium sp.]|nr:anthranilate phosphoribosyltransferase [Sphingomicrobium sp.]
MTQIMSIERQAKSVLPAADASAEQAIVRLLDGHGLDPDASTQLFAEIVEGRLSDPLMAAAFVALRVKGETSDELIGAAKALRAAAIPFPSPETLFADSCGTGGDFSGSINVSTAAGIVAAACGLPIVKHGNRSFTSKCGSADVLEALGAKLDLSPQKSRRTLDGTGFCFLLAPLYHPGIAHAGPVRRALKVRTIMNLLGPCLNPAQPSVQLLGVADPKLLRPIAKTLQSLGVRRALVVHGSGLDEIALHGPTEALLLSNEAISEVEITPEQAGLNRQPVERITGGSPCENAERLTALLAGRGTEADMSVVAINAGALLMTAGKASDLREGVALAKDAISFGTAHRLLRDFVEASNG